ncbi:hypothetical protein TERMP_02104 [Thermococcus barophilus MP]|uniref:Uncharacterized protein n=1 Tax=Thermococcus barophilus (strain DSM 11836 / MP) TaxID=391623 RepID=F0LLX9_THEBM|nr:hypothetical protein TERMP_02104 [Thermococcus barophilus MP]
MINELKKKKYILERTFGLAKTKKSAKELRAEIYDDII